MAFEWDAAKAARNIDFHGVSFVEAKSVFDDPWEVSAPDEQHSDLEERFIAVGLSDRGTVLTVVYTMRGDTVRIISARRATAHERREYEDQD